MGWDYQAQLAQHESQTDAKKGFGGKYGVQKDRQDKVCYTTLGDSIHTIHFTFISVAKEGNYIVSSLSLSLRLLLVGNISLSLLSMRVRLMQRRALGANLVSRRTGRMR